MSAMKSVAAEANPSESVARGLPKAWTLPLVFRRVQWITFVVGVIIVDVVMIGAAFRVAHLLRFEIGLGVFQTDLDQREPFYEILVGALLLIWLVMFAGMGLYNRQILLGGTEEYALVFRASTYCFVLVVTADFLRPDFIIARGWLILAWFFAFAYVSLGRFALRRAIYSLRRHGLFLSPTVIVGANREGISLAHQLLAWKTSGLQVIGFVDKKLAANTPVWHNLTILGSVDQLDAIVQDHGIEEIILASSAVSVRDNLLDIYRQYGVDNNVNLRLSSGLYEIITTGLTVREFAYVPLVNINKVRLTGIDQTLKTLLDYVLVIPALIIVAPLLCLIAVAVRLDSTGPALFRRRVMGVNGRQYDAYKFRTMHINGDELLAARSDLRAELARYHKLRDDPRVTRLGRLLRRTSLDELPQLFNVLCGQMSLVGPRMISPDEMPKYDRWGINLLTVKPGITGLWQVSGRSNISYEERVQLDMNYIRNWSIWLDLQLLMQTIPAVIRGTGAY
jgi:exopolysaccharide biosynthesis polyprenyl glycosylphosphotransferase